MSEREKRGGNGRWLAGTKSPNPAGRPPTTRQLREQLLEHLDTAVDQLLFLLAIGDPTALRIYFDRVIPSLKPTVPSVHIPGLAEATTLVEKARVVVDAVGAGQVSPDVGEQLLAALANLAKIVEVNELEQRIKALEEKDSLV